ncbi:beta-lactamase family protein [Cyanobium sp. Aljojuca 7D2]|uniref:serine hydrolase domain-containing protein n=1 Tax=Cyanobium sp. Aljojuca 7D2 TaxID=2823698 RepID=UPI0020CFB94E|nr:serine hydrolase domain-containing protein [Cyanobium sp. Aljojuca 7D2]MCP9892151.1 beta-lactamase family protein [Cyanobium sp. Aljojuca 7D2]
MTTSQDEKLIFLALLSTLLTSCSVSKAISPLSTESLPQEQVQAQAASNPSRTITQKPLRIASLDRISRYISTNAPRLVDPSGRNPQATPGLVIGVVTEEGDKYFSFGSKKLGSNDPPDQGTLFPIGSLTKVFTGLMLTQLIYEKRLQLDQSANNILPASLAYLEPNITLRHLVTNSSGLPNYPSNLADYRDLDHDGLSDFDQFNPGRNYTVDMLSTWLKSDLILEFPPGSNTKYSNLGFGILALALQNRLNYKSYHAMVASKILKPLLMKSTIATGGSDFVRSNFAIGYSWRGDYLQAAPIPNMGALAGAGELISNAEDMLILLRGLTGISANSLMYPFRQMSRPLSRVGQHTIGYGFTFHQSENGGQFAVKTASTSGYTSVLVWRTSPKIGIVILSNRGNFNRIYQVARNLVENSVK